MQTVSATIGRTARKTARKPAHEPSHAGPFLKWAGGKSQLLHSLLQHVPDTYGTYIEPFVGGGALFFACQPSRAVLSDSNEELMHTYNVVKGNVEDLIDRLKTVEHSSKGFYAMRAKKTSKLGPIDRAARFIYLNKTCFNGLYRVNKAGQFNVPLGRYANPTICNEEQLRAASTCLQNATLECGDYRKVLATHAKRGDFVYIDPPYQPVSKYSDFKRYTKEFFYEKDQVELRDLILELRGMGCGVLASNSYCDFILDLYKDFRIEVVEAKRFINNVSSKRGGVKEVIIF
jgi:DNA adenine methylase